MSTILRRIVQQTSLNGSKKKLQYLRSYCSTDNFINKEKFDKLVKNNNVVVFMKGNPEAPRCGFSNAVVQILRMHGVQYDSIDVLENEEIRQGIKEYSNWPTIPQVFLRGEFVGGCDILLQMHQSGGLIEELEKCGITSALKLSADDDKNKHNK